MDEHVKELWVKELRSGNYQQGAGCLAREVEDGSTEYCCLGVLSDIAFANGAVERRKSEVSDSIYFGERLFDLPAEVREWAGLDSSDPSVLVDPDEWESLSALNDIHKKTFDEIADMIEESL